MKITIAQINPVIGDIEENLEKIKSSIRRSIMEGSHLVIFPELSLLGFPPFDVVKNKDIKKRVEEALEEILKEIFPINVLIGAPYYDSSKVYDSVFFINKNQIIKRIDKFFIYDDSLLHKLYFSEGIPEYLDLMGKKIGILIGDDFLEAQNFSTFDDYIKNSDILVFISSSFYYFGKRKWRLERLVDLAKKYEKSIIYVNQVGGNGELIFDGGSLIISKNGEILLEGKVFEEDIINVDLDRLSPVLPKTEDISFIYNGLTLGVKDFFQKLGFRKAVIGLSGGIDSALVATIATEALGRDNVLGVSLPSIYTSSESIEDAKKLSENLGISFRIISIKDIFLSYLKELNIDKKPLIDLAEENLQSRIRGNILMFVSNREGYIVLATGNRSEALTGYCTLYGDTAGSLEVIGDIYKTTVYELANYVNRDREIIPISIIKKAPSAELRPNQKDEDSLPPYHILDQILKAYVDENKSFQEIVELGFEERVVRDVIEKVEKSEYKRRQIPPVLRIRSKNPLRERFFPLIYKII